MADAFDPDAYLKSEPSAPPFDPDAYLKTPKLSATGHLKAAATDIPSEMIHAGAEALSSINASLNPFSEEAKAATERRLKATKEGGFLGGLGETIKSGLDVGKGLMSVPALALSPVTGLGRSTIGHTLAAPGQISYEQAKEQADIAMMGIGAARGPGIGKVVPVPPPPQRGPLGVTLSEGQETGKLPLIQKEQAALRGQSGAPAQARAQEFADQQKAQLAQAREDITKSLDPAGQQVIAENPQSAGQLASHGVQQSAAQAKAGVKQSYDAAKALPGEIQASAFDDIGNSIKTDLSSRAEPIIIDDALTPYASRAIKDIEQRIERLNIQNRADPNAPPSRQNIVGVNLEGVDQMRKRLSAMRRDAYSSGNAADGRATRAVLDAFDDHIEASINNGMFNGDPRAVQAWNTARAAYADYRSTYTAGKNDPAGRVVEKIIGKDKNDPAIPNSVADFMYGSSGVNPSGLNVAVTNRIKGILGDQSPEWAGVRQGLLARLTETPKDVADWGPKKIADNIFKFLNADGKEMADIVFTSPQRTLIYQYANLMRQLEVPQAGANWSNTAAFLAPLLQKIGGKIGTNISALLGGAIGHATGMTFVGELAGAGVGAATAKIAGARGDAMQLRAIAKQMPIVADQIKAWQRALMRANISNSPPSRTAATTALGNLSRTLGSIGVDLPALQAAGIGRADQSQQDVPGPPRQ